MDHAATAARRLLARLREMMARGDAPLPEMARLVRAELGAEVCSIYAMRPGDLLELTATEGLSADAVGRTRLRVGEGIVGLSAATGAVLNLADAQNHPAFAYRPETREEVFASLLAVPVRRAGRRLGVIAVQHRAPRAFPEDEVDALQTMAMVLAEVLAAAGAADGAEEGLGATLPRQFVGTGLVGGIAVGAAVLHGLRAMPARLLADDPEAELARLAEASARMQRELDSLIAARETDGDARDVLDAYRLVAADTGWLDRVAAAVRDGLSAEAAVQRTAAELRDRMRRIGDAYLRERLADIEDMAGRLLVTLAGAETAEPVPPGAILLARRLGPAELLEWHARGIGGAVIEEGTKGGHAAVIGRALGLPMVGGTRGALAAVERGDGIVLDGDEGEIIIRPDLEVRETYARAVAAREQRKAGWAALRQRPARTADGTVLRLMINAGLPIELPQMDAVAADGIGLFRTEIATLARGGPMSAEEQAVLYARVLDAAGTRPVFFRTFDLGGDKLLPGMAAEDNPALGWRSIRIGLDRPAILRQQLRALLLAADGRPLSVMFPMIATLDEFGRARALLLAEATRVPRAPERLAVGTMLEVPALLWRLDALFAAADFVAIGSNDLAQFVFAADRAAPAVAHRYDFLSPVMLDVIEAVIAAGEAAGKPVCLCGEAAGRPLEALALAGLGLRMMSMAPSALPVVKTAMLELDLPGWTSVLRTLRAGARDGRVTSLRHPIESWAREHGIDL